MVYLAAVSLVSHPKYHMANISILWNVVNVKWYLVVVISSSGLFGSISGVILTYLSLAEQWIYVAIIIIWNNVFKCIILRNGIYYIYLWLSHYLRLCAYGKTNGVWVENVCVLGFFRSLNFYLFWLLLKIWDFKWAVLSDVFIVNCSKYFFRWCYSLFVSGLWTWQCIVWTGHVCFIVAADDDESIDDCFNVWLNLILLFLIFIYHRT